MRRACLHALHEEKPYDEQAHLDTLTTTSSGPKQCDPQHAATDNAGRTRAERQTDEEERRTRDGGRTTNEGRTGGRRTDDDRQKARKRAREPSPHSHVSATITRSRGGGPQLACQSIRARSNHRGLQHGHEAGSRHCLRRAIVPQ